MTLRTRWLYVPLYPTGLIQIRKIGDYDWMASRTFRKGAHDVAVVGFGATRWEAVKDFGAEVELERRVVIPWWCIALRRIKRLGMAGRP